MAEHATLAAAFIAFQSELPRIRKSASGQVAGRRDYKYADLGDVTHEVIPVLNKHGLGWSCQPDRADDGTPVLRWELMHVSGESRTGDMELPSGVNPQNLGSVLTYWRRYGLTSVTSVVADEDDDGAAAADTSVRGRRSQPSQGKAPQGSPSQGTPSAQRTTTAGGTPAKPVKTPEQRAADFVTALADAGTMDRAEKGLAAVIKSDVANLDVSGLVHPDHREALGVNAGEKLTLNELAVLVVGYVEKHGKSVKAALEVSA